MFNFIKKGVSATTTSSEKDRDKTDKDKRKKEKKSRKEIVPNISSSMSSEELLRLDEVRRSLKIRGRRKEKEKLPSGITADYSAEFFAHLDVDRPNGSKSAILLDNNGDLADHSQGGINISYSDSSETSLHSVGKVDGTRPPVPPKRGILKGPRLNVTNADNQTTVAPPPESSSLLMRNTIQNELISFENLSLLSNNSVDNTRDNIHGSVTLGNLHILTSSSPSADSLTDTTNSSFATPPFSLSPVGESQGTHKWSRVQTFEDINLPLPPINFITLPAARELTIKRQKTPRNDFGFSLRNAIRLDRSESLLVPTCKPTIFAEPGAGGDATGLLPGDRLISVNGQSVEEMPRDKIIEIIRNCDDCVKVVVQPVAELVELSKRCMDSHDDKSDEVDRVEANLSNCNTLKRSASKRFKSSSKKDDNLSMSLNTEKVWLIHRGGFCLATKSILPTDNNSCQQDKVTITLVHNGEKLQVEEDELEKANPPSLDLSEDICNLKQLNEASVLHCLRQRFASNLIHTKAGSILIVVNPMAPLSLYSEKVVSMFRGCKNEDMPPHIYSTAQSAYRAMLESRRDQSLIFMGRSGSGKTASFKHALYYLSLASGSVNKFLTVEKINAINTILEAFGHTKTCLNSNSTRFTQMLSLDFDHSGMIASASVQVLLLEKSRAGRRAGNEQTFLVLSRLIAGASGSLQKELNLEGILSADNNPFVSLSAKLEERTKAAAEFLKLQQSFTVLNVDDVSVKGLWLVLAAIAHLGHAGVAKVENGQEIRFQFAKPTAARRAADLLGVSMEDLTNVVFPSTDNVNSSKTVTMNNVESAWDSLEGLVIGLYSEVVAAVVALINSAICTTVHTINSILLIDTPGFQNPSSCGFQAGATLSDLRHNYLQERLHLLFHHTTLVAPLNRYSQELVEIDKDGFSDSNPNQLATVIDKVPQNHVLRPTQRDLREHDRRGLFWLLDEESAYPESNDDTFLERLFSHYGDREHQAIIRRAAGNHQFMLQHFQGTNPVLYSVDGWLKQSKEHITTAAASSLLQDSVKNEINRVFSGALIRGGNSIYCGSVAGMEGTQSLRRVSSLRRSFTSAGSKRNSSVLQVKFVVDGIVDTLRRTGTHFVHCFLLQHNAGIKSVINSSTLDLTEDIVNVPLLRSQLRGSHILEAARLHKLGFPESMPHSEFIRRFGLLGDVSAKDNNVDQILSHNEIDSSTYRIGPSQVLLRSGVLNQLEAKRDELLSDRIIQFQAVCRGFLARKRVSRRRVQELAVRCIQRNVRAFLTVRDWPWWRLLVRVSPLLNVHRTEDQLKIALDELQTFKAKLEKSETDRNLLKIENGRLESKLSEMTVDLSEERSASNIQSERLDAETAERIKLSKELELQQNKVRNLQDMSEKLEMDLIAAKSDLNGLSEDEEGDNEESNNIYRIKYDRAAKELDFTRRRLQTQHEHDLEQLVGLKKQLEKKLADAYEEVEEQRQVVGQWKRKTQKFSVEMNDLRMLLEEQNGRNNLLEKRQRKFDSESQSLQDAVRQEKSVKDRLAREKDILIAEKFTLEQNLADTRLELELKNEKLSSLQQELEEITFSGGTEEEIAHLKRSKLEWERKCKEQEEELDEMAGQVQLLEQAKLRLEMTLETMRKEARRETQQRDEELEEVRGSSYKKLKALECQLEIEHEERTLLLREKHELERRLQNIEQQDNSDRAAEEATILKLKRDLRKYKALLKDAQSQLERAKADSPGKVLIRQLRNQLEDAEAARAIALKSRQLIEADLADVQLMLDESSRGRNDAEEKATQATREKAELQTQIEENEEELAEIMKKYTSVIKQLNAEQTTISENEIRISELEMEKNSLKEQIDDLHARLENVENSNDSSATIQTKRLVLRTKELESKLELEQATRARIEVQSGRHKDALEKLQTDLVHAKTKEIAAQDSYKKSQKSIRDLREELNAVSNREHENVNKRQDVEKKLETTESELTCAKNDLRLALQRIADLQQAMEDEDDDDSCGSDDQDSTDDSLSDQEISINSTINRLRNSRPPLANIKEEQNGQRNIVPSSNSSSLNENHTTEINNTLGESTL